MKQIPVDAKRADWPRLVAQTVNRLQNTAAAAAGSAAWGSVTGTLSAQTDLQSALDAKQSIDTQLTSLAGLAYAGNGLKAIRVNAGETGFELATAGGGPTGGITTIDFGAFPGASDTKVTITGQTGILSGSSVKAWLIATDTADHSADEHWIETIEVMAGNIVPGTGFDIYAKNTGTLSEPVIEQWANTRLAGPGTGVKQVRPDNGGGQGTRLYGEYTVAWEWY